MSSLNECVELLARHYQGSLERIEALEARDRSIVYARLAQSEFPSSEAFDAPADAPAALPLPSNVFALPEAPSQRRRSAHFTDTRGRLHALMERRVSR